MSILVKRHAFNGQQRARQKGGYKDNLDHKL